MMSSEFNVGDLLNVVVERKLIHEPGYYIGLDVQKRITLGMPLKKAICLVVKKRPTKVQMPEEKSYVYTLWVPNWNRLCDFQTFDLKDAEKL